MAAPGFKLYRREVIQLNVQDRLRVDAQMEIGGRTEQILVTGEVALVQTDTSSLGQVISSQQVVDMPLNGRNYVDLASLTTGVVNTANGTNGNTAGAFSSNGTRGDLNNYLLDGIDNNNNSGGASQLAVNVDAIAEFKIQTNSYDAEFGRSGGAALNGVIKSGTNQFHGSLLVFSECLHERKEFLRDHEESFLQVQPAGCDHGRPDKKEQAVLLWRLSAHGSLAMA